MCERPVEAPGSFVDGFAGRRLFASGAAATRGCQDVEGQGEGSRG